MLTLAFASFNGADTLPIMLEALMRLQAPKGGWRLIAVNNASTDGTHAILESYLGRLPLTILQQPARGKAKALNLALEHVEGDLLVLTDDDVIPNPDWLEACRGFADAYPEFGIFGGKIKPHWMQPPPQWILSSIPLGLAYVLTGQDRISGKIDPRYITGNHMAIRTDAISGGLRFDTALGPCGSDYAVGEDTAFAYAAESQGFAAAYCSRAVVRHIIQAYQYNKVWLLRRAYRYGQVRGMEDFVAQQNSGSATWLHIPRWMVREYLKHHVLATAGWLSGNTETLMSAAWEARYLAGYLSGYRHQQTRQIPAA